MNGLYAVVVERNSPTNEGVKDNAKAPNVHLWSNVGFPGEHLRGREVGGSTGGGEMPGRVEDGGKIKVRDLHLTAGRKEYIFQLYITVHNSIVVAES
jgi:hypothetical protein